MRALLCKQVHMIPHVTIHQPQQQSLHGTSIACHRLLSAVYWIRRLGKVLTVMHHGSGHPGLRCTDTNKTYWSPQVSPVSDRAGLYTGRSDVDLTQYPKSRLLLLVKFSTQHTPRHIFLGTRQRSHCQNTATMSTHFYNDFTPKHLVKGNRQ